MFTNILIGIDGRDGGHDAIVLARLLAAPEATLTLAFVCTPFLGRGAAEAVVMERAEAQRMLEDERELAGLAANLAVKGPRSVGRGLHELAEDARADLLVVGSTRHNLLGRVVAGDDCRAALDGATCAVAIAPSGYSRSAHQLRHLGVGYNASPGSERALSAARELVDLHGGEIEVLWVISPEDVRAEKPIPADWPSASADLMDHHTRQLAQLEGVQGVVACDGPREALARFGRNLDLLVVGSRDHKPFDRLVHGTVPRYLARHAACPLLIISPEAGALSPTPGLDHEADLITAGDR